MTATMPADAVTPEWYGLPPQQACETLGVDPGSGLSAAQVLERRAQYGSNALAAEAKEPAWRAFLRQYRDLMQLVLLGAALVSIIALQDVSTGIVIIALTVF